jgi:rifampicin phosphotransferase
MSSCNEVVSADVPNQLREIADLIKDKEQFKLFSNEEALNYLKTGTDEASLKFREFLIKYGHRGYREMDAYYPTWADNPIPCIKTIKVYILLINY